jgi:hypothetical protein
MMTTHNDTRAEVDHLVEYVRADGAPIGVIAQCRVNRR